MAGGLDVNRRHTSVGGTVVVAADVIVTADPDQRVLTPGWVRIDRGVITEIGDGRPPVGTQLLRGDIAMPGLVSAHQHLVDVLVRGGPAPASFLDWLLGTYHAGLSNARPEDCFAAVSTVRAATLAAGVTTVVDGWSVGAVDDPRRVAGCAVASLTAHRRSGGRTLFAPMFVEQVPAVWSVVDGFDPERLCRPVGESLDLVAELAAAHSDHLMSVTPSPELPETSTAAGLRAARELAETLGSVVPMHVCASPSSRAACGPNELAEVGLLGPQLLAAHCSAVDEQDVAWLGGAGIGVAHCPTSSRALGRSPLTPLAALRAAGARGALGLDNASLHSGVDLFAEAREAALVATSQGQHLAADDLIAMLTAEAAVAIGMGDRIGSLEVGKRGDVVLLDASRPHWWPRADRWADTIMQCARADDVTAVLVDGTVVAHDGLSVRHGEPHRLDAAARRLRALRWERLAV